MKGSILLLCPFLVQIFHQDLQLLFFSVSLISKELDIFGIDNFFLKFTFYQNRQNFLTSQFNESAGTISPFSKGLYFKYMKLPPSKQEMEHFICRSDEMYWLREVDLNSYPRTICLVSQTLREVRS